jgi:hypothetical protein
VFAVVAILAGLAWCSTKALGKRRRVLAMCVQVMRQREERERGYREEEQDFDQGAP